MSRILRLALLAPDIEEAILAGRTDQALLLQRLEQPLPSDRQQQRMHLPTTDGASRHKQLIAADRFGVTTNGSAGQRRGVGLALEGADGIEDTLEHRLLAAAHGLVGGGL
jgi:hypothetical protein